MKPPAWRSSSLKPMGYWQIRAKLPAMQVSTPISQAAVAKAMTLPVAVSLAGKPATTLM